MARTVIPAYAILNNPDWMRWNASRSSLRVVNLSYKCDGAELAAALYATRGGCFTLPSLTPYLSMEFSENSDGGGHSTARKRTRDWLNIAGAFASELKKSGISGTLSLPPTVTDVRPFQWAGFVVEPRYTYTGALPFETDTASSGVWKQVRRASARGYSIDDDPSFETVSHCLNETAYRKGFRLPLSATDIANLVDAVGRQKVRVLAVRNSEGATVSAGIRLLEEHSTGLGWIQGTNRNVLSDGVAQLVQSAALADLSEHGAIYYDYMGANNPSVAQAKSAWGLDLTSYYTIRLPDVATRLQRGLKRGGSIARTQMGTSIGRLRGKRGG